MYFDFELRAWSVGDDRVNVLVHSSPMGVTRRPVLTTYDRAQLDQLRNMLNESRWYVREDLHATFRTAGHQLWQVLFPGEVHDLLKRNLDYINTSSPDNRLRIRLCLDDHLIDYPWEYIYWPEAAEAVGASRFLVLDPNISLVREATTAAASIAPTDKQLRMIFASARSQDNAWNVREERQAIRESLRSMQEDVAIEYMPAFQDYLEEAFSQPVDIFHYAGYTEQRPDGAAMVQEMPAEHKRSKDKWLWLPSEELARLLGQAGTRLAVLRASNSGQWPFARPLLDTGLSTVIGTLGRVSPTGAIAFCDSLYQGLAAGMSLDEAVSLARLQMTKVTSATGHLSLEWGTFVVYMPTANAILFPRPQDTTRQRQALLRQPLVLLDILRRRFGESDFRDLCFALRENYDIDYDNLDGDNKGAKARSLLYEFMNRNKLADLIKIVQQLRPDITI